MVVVRIVRQRIMLVNALRAHLAEFGIVAGVGRNGLEKLLEVIADDQDARVPPEARSCLLALRDQLVLAKQQILEADRRILAWHRASEMSRRLDEIPGVGPLIEAASAVRGHLGVHVFVNLRQRFDADESAADRRLVGRYGDMKA